MQSGRDGGKWMTGQPMPMVGRPCTVMIDTLEKLVSKLPNNPKMWYWGANDDDISLECESMICNREGVPPAGNEAELLDWASKFSKGGWLIADCRESIGKPKTSTPLIELLCSVPVPVIVVVEGDISNQPFPPWEPLF